MNSLYQASRSSDDVLWDVAYQLVGETMHQRAMSTARISLMLVNLYSDHWYLLVIYPELQQIHCLNWLPTSTNSIKLLCRLMHVYLFAHSAYDAAFEFAAADWTFCVISPDRCPRQLNGYDCGAFACRAAERIAAGQPLDFVQSTMADFRYKHLLALKTLDNNRLSCVPVDATNAINAITLAVGAGAAPADALIEIDPAEPDDAEARKKKKKKQQEDRVQTSLNEDDEDALNEVPEYYY